MLADNNDGDMERASPPTTSSTLPSTPSRFSSFKLFNDDLNEWCEPQTREVGEIVKALSQSSTKLSGEYSESEILEKG